MPSTSFSAACATALRPRTSSNTSGLRFCGMIDEPVVKASGRLTIAEFLRIEQQQVGGEPAEVLRQQGDFEQQLRLGFAARQLHRGHRLLGDGKTQPPARGFAVDVEIRRAESGRGSQGVLADAPLRGCRALGIVAHFRGKSESPQRDAARHGLLHVGVAGKLD